MGLGWVELNVQPPPHGEFWAAKLTKLASKELYLILIVLITSCEVLFINFIVIRSSFGAY